MRTTQYFFVLLLAIGLLPGRAIAEQAPLTKAIPPNDSTNSAAAMAFPMDRAIFALDYNSYGNLLAAAGRGPTIDILQPLLGSELKTLEGVHKDDIWAVAFNPDDRLLATGGVDKLVVIWDVASALPLRIMEKHTDYVTAIEWSPDGETLASSSRDGSVIFWEAGTGRFLRQAEVSEEALTGLAFSPDGLRFATSCEDGTVRIHDVETLSTVSRLEGHEDDVTCVKWSSRSGLVASGSWDNTAAVWNSAAKKRVSNLEGHNTDVTCISFSPDGTILATSGGDRIVKIWDLPTGKEIASITETAHDSDVEDITFNHNGTQLATCSRDGKIKVWTVPSLEERMLAATRTGIEKWKVRGPYESTDDYNKRMKRSVRYADELRQEMEGQLAKFYEENVDWRSDLSFRTYNADGEYFPLTSPLFGSLKVSVSKKDAPLVAENMDGLTFEDLKLRVRNGRMELRRFSAVMPGDGKKFAVTIL